MAEENWHVARLIPTAKRVKTQAVAERAMYVGHGFDDSLKAEMQAVFDPFGEGRTVGPPADPSGLPRARVHRPRPSTVVSSWRRATAPIPRSSVRVGVRAMAA